MKKDLRKSARLAGRKHFTTSCEAHGRSLHYVSSGECMACVKEKKDPTKQAAYWAANKRWINAKVRKKYKLRVFKKVLGDDESPALFGTETNVCVPIEFCSLTRPLLGVALGLEKIVRDWSIYDFRTKEITKEKELIELMEKEKTISFQGKEYRFRTDLRFWVGYGKLEWDPGHSNQGLHEGWKDDGEWSQGTPWKELSYSKHDELELFRLAEEKFKDELQRARVLMKELRIWYPLYWAYDREKKYFTPRF